MVCLLGPTMHSPDPNVSPYVFRTRYSSNLKPGPPVTAAVHKPPPSLVPVQRHSKKRTLPAGGVVVGLEPQETALVHLLQALVPDLRAAGFDALEACRWFAAIAADTILPAYESDANRHRIL